MKLNYIVFLTFLFSVFNYTGHAQVKAFPSAEGYGKYATGGRGGEVVEVTNLEDYATGEIPIEGSFRWAFTQKRDSVKNRWGVWIYWWKPVTIVFKVGGVINLKEELRVKRDSMTIAGQTAPGDGICIRGATVNFSGSENVIVRYMRFRPGDELGEETSAFRIENGGNFIIDHCSMSWAIEETTHFSSSPNFTVQWCIVSESLYNSFHKKGARGYGTQWGGQYASYHHNLLAHHNSRMPRINGSNENDVEALVDYRNNVNYNWGSTGAFYGGEWMKTGGLGFAHTNVVNNYFIPGPATSSTVVFARPSRGDTTYPDYSKWYFNGNVMVGHTDMTNDNWLGVSDDNIGSIDNIRSDEEFVQLDGVLEDHDNYTQSAEEAYQSIIEDVGATLPKRDAHDIRLIKEMTGEIDIIRYEYTDSTGKVSPIKGISAGLIDTQENLVSPEDRTADKTAWDVYVSIPESEAPVDSDHDGMPDIWEIQNGLNPEDYTDGKLIAENGYSNLENYLNGLTLTVDVKDFHKNSGLIIFPNPAEDLIQLSSYNIIQKIEIYALNGTLMKVVDQKSGIHEVSVESIPVGIYVLRATSDNQQEYIKKLIRK